MLRLLELGALAFAVGLPTAAAVRISEPVPAAAAARANGLFPLAGGPVAEPGSPPSKIARVIKRADDGMFYIEGRVNGVPVRFLVDTGASVVVLTKADAMAIGLVGVRPPTSSSLRTVSGYVETRWTRLDLDLGGHTLPAVDAAVIDDGPGVSLLGQNALAAFGSITIEGDRLVLR